MNINRKKIILPNNIRDNLENFLDGPGNIDDNRRKNLGRLAKTNHNHIIIIILFIAIALSLLFYALPFIDIEFSRLFVMHNQKFTLLSFIGNFYHGPLIKLMQYICVLVAVFYLVGEILKKPILTLTRRRFLFILISIAITAGLMTNFVLKEHWGRARPRDVIEFGGSKLFTPACVISNQCKNNCSFVSGEASFAFSFICFALLARRYRKLWIYGILIFASSIALMRVAIAAHFLSDTVLAGIYTILVILLIQRLLLVTDSRKN